jgi:hypothetical protein
VVEHNFLSGKTLPNAEKFKYMQQNVGGYSTIAEAASVSYPNTVYMFNAQKCILGYGKSVNFCVIKPTFSFFRSFFLSLFISSHPVRCLHSITLFSLLESLV